MLKEYKNIAFDVLNPRIFSEDNWVTARSLGLAFEYKVGRGKLIVSGVDLLTGAETRPETRQCCTALKSTLAARALTLCMSWALHWLSGFIKIIAPKKSLSCCFLLSVMKTSDVIIIGAGAAGLFAAYTLVKAGKKVTVLEARNRMGGRIHTVANAGFAGHAELGAEFVHGNLPVTLNLLDEAGIAYTPVSFEMWQYHNGAFSQSNEFVEKFDELLGKINDLQKDMPLHDFLELHFSQPEYDTMRLQVKNYVAGYDTADIHDVSAFALRNEWNHEDEDAQHRLTTGYGSMVKYLADACTHAGSEIVLNSVAKEVVWHNSHVKVITANGSIYDAQKLIIALPLGVLQSDAATDGAITFNPAIPQHQAAIQDMGFGALIKIVLEFDTPFWENAMGTDLSTMGFLFTDEVIPTYWTQAPAHSPIFTGWLGGPPALAKKDATDQEILCEVLRALSNVFSMTEATLKEKLVAWHVANWTAEPYTRGSYAYDKVASPEARAVLLQPVNDTIYFAGEYLYDGPAMGTVEAALTSGKATAEQLLKSV